VDIGCWATTFTGSEIQDFTLEPSAFTIDDDRYLSEGVETGMSPVQLSDTRKALMPSLPLASDSEIQLYLFIDVPDPFYDQDYAGKVVIDMGE
jgi:hypothetical protein